MRLKKDEAVLVAIDFQEKLFPKMYEPEKLSEKVITLIKGCRILNVPVLVTQQYTKGLGATIKEVQTALGEFSPIEKTAFSAWSEPTFKEALENTGKKSVILCGIENHVCVQQTALDLLQEGYRVYLITDCVSSRAKADRKQAKKRMAAAGCILTTCESILFELLEDAKAPEFKQISALVK